MGYGASYGLSGATGGYSRIVKTADTTAITSATPANVTVGAAGGGNLALPVVAGHRYRVRITWCLQSDTGTTGWILTCTIPAKTRFALLVNCPTAADGAAAEFQGTINTSGDAVTVPNAPVTNQDLAAVADGILVPSANGSITVQIANEAGAGNVAVMEGTCLELWDLSV